MDTVRYSSIVPQDKLPNELMDRVLSICLFLSEEFLRFDFSKAEQNRAVGLTSTVIDLISKARDDYTLKGFEDFYMLGSIASSFQGDIAKLYEKYRHVKEISVYLDRLFSTAFIRLNPKEGEKYEAMHTHPVWFPDGRYGNLDIGTLDGLVGIYKNLAEEDCDPDLRYNDVVDLSNKLKQNQVEMESIMWSVETLQASFKETLPRAAKLGCSETYSTSLRQFLS